MEVGSLEDVDSRRWESVVESSPEATVFHSLEWLRVQKKLFQLQERLFYTERCVFPVFVRKKGPLKVYGSPLPETGALYGGPACTEVEAYPGAIETLDEVGEVGPFSAIFIKTPSGFNSSLYRGYRVEPVGNYILDLGKGKTALWEKMNKKTRNAVRKAYKSGVSFKFCGEEYLGEYYGMLKEVAQRTSISPLPEAFFREVLKSGLGKLALTFYRGEPAAGGVFLTFKDTVIYWSGASKYELRRYQPSNLLHWEVIKWAESRGYSKYDLGGAGVPVIAKFKKGWGGDYVEFYRVYKEGKVAGMARKIYQSLRRYPLITRFYRKW